MEIPDAALSDGSVGIDYSWKRTLTKLLADTPLPTSLADAVQSLVDVDLDLLNDVVEGKQSEWSETLYSRNGGFQLPPSYPLDYAIAIHVYTLEDPSVYRVVNRAMFNPNRRQGIGGVSAELRACLPYIKFLDAALAALPEEYIFRGEVRRGIKHVFPSTDSHNPQTYFTEGARIMWYEFKSTSERQEVMTRPHFCGVEAGPRTIFSVSACRGYSIKKFSFFQGALSEYEVLFRPLSEFKVKLAQKNIIDPKEMSSVQRSGFPDMITLEQVDTTATKSSGRSPAATERG